MQRWGPSPAYPNLRIPGLNAPIPVGAQWGFHPGGWGKPPVDDVSITVEHARRKDDQGREGGRDSPRNIDPLTPMLFGLEESHLEGCGDRGSILLYYGHDVDDNDESFLFLLALVWSSIVWRCVWNACSSTATE
jgi:hypothetical protein